MIATLLAAILYRRKKEIDGKKLVHLKLDAANFQIPKLQTKNERSIEPFSTFYAIYLNQH